MLTQPHTDEYAAYYSTYIKDFPEGDLLSLMASIHEESERWLRSLPEEAHNFRYAEGKWSFKEFVQHIIDTERIMGVRALCIARGDTTPLPGFDVDAYAQMADVENVALDQLLEEWRLLRRSHLMLFERFTPEEALRRGTASGYEVSVRALAYILVGHERYHIRNLKRIWEAETQA